MNFKHLIPVFILMILAINVSAHTYINFYDENSLDKIPTVTITDSNGSTYTSDVNGLWTIAVTGAKSFDISKTGYATRPLDFNFTADANYNFLLNPTSLDSNIGFIVKDTNNNLWTNKYLMFQQSASSNSIDINKYMQHGSGSSSMSAIIFTPKVNLKLYSVLFYAKNNYTGTILLRDGSDTVTYATIGSATYTSGTSYTIIFNVDVNAGQQYMIKSSTTALFYVTTDVQGWLDNPYILRTGGQALEIYGKFNTPTIPQNIIFRKYGVNYINNNIINSILTSSTGTATGSLAPAGDYNALLYTASSVLTNTYQKTTVTVNKPLNEKTAVSISPYDIYVSGLLQYNLTNQTASSIPFNIFAGTDGFYTFTAVDYNAVTSDQKYIPKSYFVQVPLGTSYVSTLTYTPYLLLKTDGIVPKVIVIDKLNRTVENAQIFVSKYIGGVLTIVESGNTFANGVFNFSAYPLDVYYLSVYLNGVSKGVYSVQPRESTDEFYIQIDRTSAEDIAQSLIINTDLNRTRTYKTRDTNINVLGTITSNLNYITDYNVNVYERGNLIYSNKIITSGLSIDINKYVDVNLIPTYVSNARVVVLVNYSIGGLTGTKTFEKTIYVTDGVDKMTSIRNSATDIGQPLAIIIAFIITMMLIASLVFSGILNDPAILGVFGIIVLGFFMYIGYLDIGITALGLDVGRFAYIIGAIATLYFMFFGGR